MATSPESFNQVKNLLRKLDQSIDAARSRRLTSGPTGKPAPAPAAAPMRSDVNPNRARPLPPRTPPAAPGSLPRPGGF